MKLRAPVSFLGIVLLSGATVNAQPFESIRIGDIDGFGYGSGLGLTAANGGPCNVDGVGLLSAGDYLPDLNLNGVVATGAGDDWDNRSALELGGGAVTAIGASDFAGTLGSEFTDVSISTSFGGDPGTFPGFGFDFFVDGGDVSTGADMFINVVFGDYDVFPASVRYTRADLTSFTVPLVLQGAGDDGLIQAAFATVPFADVFTAEGGGWRGTLLVDFVAPNEPYLAFDFAEISTEPIRICDPDPRTQGYWHRQCLGVPTAEGGLDPGRNGSGPRSPTEPGFNPALMDCGSATLEDLGFVGVSTCEGMDADPPRDRCERALKQTTALILNICSDRLQGSCLVDLSAAGCFSTTVGELLTELSQLISVGACRTAADCAAAVNEGVGLSQL